MVRNVGGSWLDVRRKAFSSIFRGLRLGPLACAVFALAISSAPRLAAAEVCGTVSAKGCCDGTTLKYCQADNTLAKVNCAAYGATSCDWSSGWQFYGCQPDDPGTPPGESPKACVGAPSACMADCTGKVCGTDGCGGSCGNCATGSTCDSVSGTCIDDTKKPCGDLTADGCCDGTVAKVCISGQVFGANCIGLQGTCAFDPLAQPGLPKNFCVWSPAADQSGYKACPKQVCVPKCDAKSCGDDGCGGTCGTCGTSQTCEIASGLCKCKADCAGKSCGGDGCAGTCGSCQSSQTCDEKSKDVCGIAKDFETLTLSCPTGAVITAIKYAEYGNVAGTCPSPQVSGCKATGTLDYIKQNCLNKNSCATTSWHLTLGDPCPNKPKAMAVVATCSSGGGGAVCKCTPNCAGKTCGDDGCGGTCGSCKAGESCDAKTGACAVPVATCGVVQAIGSGLLTTFPAGLNGVKEVRMHAPYALALKYDGTVVGWGDTADPAVVAAPQIKDAVALTMGVGHAGVVLKNGTVEILGDCQGPFSQPCKVPAGLTGVAQLALASPYGIALKTDGTVAMWPSDAALPDWQNLTGVTYIAAGAGSSAAAVLADGTVKVWQPAAPELAAKQPAGLKATKVLLRGCWAAALKPDKTVALWANCANEMDTLQVTATNVVALAGGNGVLVTLLADGTAKAWGPDAGKVTPSIANLKGITHLALGLDGSGVAVTCSAACGAVAPIGCCTGDTLNSCSGPNGTASQQSCAAGTCGWNSQTGVFACGTAGKSLAANAWTKACCTPDCAGKTCGNDSCGGSCGTCKAGEACGTEGTCKAPVQVPCGGLAPLEGCCDGQLAKTCAKNNQGQYEFVQNDCTATNPKGFCSWLPLSSEYRCGAKDLGSDPSGKLPKACPGKCAPNCVGKSCGDDGCGGNCGTCKSGSACDANQCKAVCTPNCPGKACGDDGCGGVCGLCPNGNVCTAGACKADPCEGVPPEGCCDGQVLKRCETYKKTPFVSSKNCPFAGQICSWNPKLGTSGAYYCTVKDLGADPSGKVPKKCPNAQCASNCVGKTCGPDGCGGQCGTCASGTSCQANGTCCTPSCKGKASGSDGCGGSCGNCGPGYVWDLAAGACKCAPSCVGKTCGSDGCGGQCGTCAANSTCDTAKGQCLCVKKCSGKVCGPDGCGGQCGSCGTGFACDTAGKCTSTCKPVCTGKSCGSDGCGGSCGTCKAGTFCDDTTATCLNSKCPTVPAANCCVGDKVQMCGAGGQTLVNCAASGEVCGWISAQGAYGCISSTFKQDPSGKAPRLCPGQPACKPYCGVKQCGSDGCGGFCGFCQGQKVCEPATGMCSKTKCAGVPAAGCCEGNSYVFCTSKGQTEKGNCSTPYYGGAGYKCGWYAGAKSYSCTKGPDTNDPSGASVAQCPSGKCQPDCAGKTCGPDGCGGNCEWNGGCPEGWTCEPGGKSCKAPCVPNCWSNAYKGAKKTCGADGCGGTCGTCKAGESCSPDTGWCVPPKVADPCAGVDKQFGCCDGNVRKSCNQGQITSKTCAKGTCGWKPIAGTGYFDCDTDGGVDPSGKAVQACVGSAVCKPDCAGKACGSDGCGGWCGQCSKVGEVCEASSGQCIESCEGIPFEGCCEGELLRICSKKGGTLDDVANYSCAGKSSCGWNANGKGQYSCYTDGKADPKGFRLKPCPGPLGCAPDCAGKACGDDGCGGTCGICATGTSCFAQTGKCVVSATSAACGAVKWEGGCDGSKAVYCSNGSLIGQECKVGGKGECGWIAALAAYGCGGNGGDPSGTFTKAAPGATAACVPSCTGKQCGSDGCGGSCGSCAPGAACLGSGLCGAPGYNYPLVSAGCCAADDVAHQLDADGGISTVNCTGKAPQCGFDATDQTYECGTIGQNGLVTQDPTGAKKRACPVCTPASGGPCSFDSCGKAKGICGNGTACDYKTGQCKTDNGGSCTSTGSDAKGQGYLCGQFKGEWSCQCDADCSKRGDCCNGFESDCGAKVFGGQVCGNGTCETGQGETCITCSADCQPCTWPESTQNWSPPLSAPWQQVIALPGSPASHAAFVYDALDSVLPSGPPLSTSGLLAWLPRLGAEAGPPAAQFLLGVVPGKAKPGVAQQVSDEFPAKQGAGFSFALNTVPAQPSWGLLRVRPGTPLPVAPSYPAKQAGGYSLAFWLKIATDAADVPSPLVATRGGSISENSDICAWSRPEDSAVRLECPAAYGVAQQIVDIEAYYGEVLSPTPPSGSCAAAAKLAKSYKCQAPAMQAAAETACLGKKSCLINGWDVAKDPCSPPPHVPNLSTLVVRAVCAYKPLVDGAMLVVESKKAGGRLRFEIPGVKPLVAEGDLRNGTWRHVALTFHPYGNSRVLGVTSIFVDGDLKATSTDLNSKDIREFVFGAAQLPGAQAAWPNTAGAYVATLAAFDDIFVYGRAITGPEVRSLFKKPETKLLRVWPALPAGHVVQSGAWIHGGKAVVAPIEAPHLADASTGKLVQSPTPALGLGTGVAFRQTGIDGDLGYLNGATLMGWVRLPKLEAGKVLLRLLQDGKPDLTVATTGDCSGRGVTAWRGPQEIDKVKVKVTSCAHGFAANEWAFVAVIQAYGSLRVFVDGHEVGQMASAAGELFQGPASSARTFESGNGVDLFWAGLFGAMPPAELHRWRSMGPAVWLDGGSYTTAGSAKPRDFANFHNNTVGGAKDQAGFYSITDQPSKIAAGAGPLQVGQGEVFVAQMPAAGRLGPTFGAVSAKFSFAGRTNIHNLATIYPIVGQVKGSLNYFRAHLLCTRGKDGAAARLKCSVQVVAMDTSGKTRKWQSKERVADLHTSSVGAASSKAMETALWMDVAVTWDGYSPKAAFGTPELAKGQDLLLRGKLAEMVEVPAAANELYSGDKFFASGPDLQFVLNAPKSTLGYGLWKGIRVYPRVLSDVELEALTQHGCESRDCAASGKVCKHSWPNTTLAVCAGCDSGSLEASGVLGGQCLAKRGFFEVCTTHVQCATGLCSNGRCSDSSASKACVAACEGLGRLCVKVSPQPTYSCSTACADYYRPPQGGEGSAETGVCSWVPVSGLGDECTAHAQCQSGLCELAPDARYSAAANWTPDCKAGSCPGWAAQGGGPLQCGTGPYAGGSYFGGGTCPPTFAGAPVADLKMKRCAAAKIDECTAGHKTATVLPGKGLFATDAITCQQCEKTSFAGKPIWIKGWNLMAPEVCSKLHKGLTTQAIAFKAGWSELDAEPSFELFTKFYFKTDKGIQPEQISQLEKDGVGPELIGFMKGSAVQKQKLRDKYGRLWLGDCMRVTWEEDLTPGKFVVNPKTGNSEFLFTQDRVTPFMSTSSNKQICVANKFPNGTLCPPPGSNASQDQADAFCDSGFCARDSHRCEKGVGRLEVGEGADRADKQKSSKPDNDTGSMNQTQQNTGVLEVTKVKQPPAKAVAAAGAPKARKFSIGGGTSQNFGAFDESGKDFFSMSIDMTVQPNTSDTAKDGSGEFDASVFLVGIKIPQSGSPASSCGGVGQWENGKLKEEVPKCKAWKSPADAVPALPKSKPCIAAPIGCEATDAQKALKASKVKTVEKGKACWKKTSFVGPVPILVIAEVVLEACFGVGTAVDSETMAPEFQLVPEINAELSIKGGVGASFDAGVVELEVIAGIKAAITIVNLAFPIKWGMAVEDGYEDGNPKEVVQDLYSVKYYRKVDIELTILKLLLALFFEVNVSVGVANLATSFEYELFTFDGLKFVWNIRDDVLGSTKVDLLKDFKAVD